MVRWIQLSIAQPGLANSTRRVEQAQQGPDCTRVWSAANVTLPLGAGEGAAAYTLNITASVA